MVGTVLNLLFVGVEAVAGFVTGSVGLLSDAGHNLSDVVALLLAWLAFRLSRVPANTRFTYGYGKSTVLVALLNAALLLVAIGMIALESAHKLMQPQPIDGGVVIWVASVGIAVNMATALLFLRDRRSDLNVNGAFLHMAMDALVSLGVVLSGVLMRFTGWYIIDPIVGLLVAVVIFVSTWRLLRQSVRLSLDGVPADIDAAQVHQLIAGIDGVADVHHLHLWALSTTSNALTAHIALRDIAQAERVKADIRHLLAEHGIAHATIETELEGHACGQPTC